MSTRRGTRTDWRYSKRQAEKEKRHVTYGKGTRADLQRPAKLAGCRYRCRFCIIRAKPISSTSLVSYYAIFMSLLSVSFNLVSSHLASHLSSPSHSSSKHPTMFTHYVLLYGLMHHVRHALIRSFIVPCRVVRKISGSGDAMTVCIIMTNSLLLVITNMQRQHLGVAQLVGRDNREVGHTIVYLNGYCLQT